MYWIVQGLIEKQY